MNIFLKYLFRSTLFKKGRSFLLIVTITISTSLVIGTLGAATAGSNASKEQAKRYSGNYNVIINSKNITETQFFNDDNISKEEFEQFVTSISVEGYLSENVNGNIMVDGVTEENYERLPNMNILKKDEGSPVKKGNIIISEKISKLYDYKIGDIIKVNLRGKDKSFKVGAIAETNGVFSTDLNNRFTVVGNREDVYDVLGMKGISNTIFVKLKGSLNANKFIEKYNEENNESVAVLAFNEDKADADAKQIVLLFYLILVIVVFMSSFIIYSCFKLIVIERMPVIGTFLSMGETKTVIIKLLLGESLIYGIISGLLSLVLGRGVLYLLADICNNFKQYGVSTKPDYNISYFSLGFIFSIVISLISALIPVLVARKLQVKDLILNKISVTYKKSYKLFVFGAILALGSIIMNFIDSSISIKFSPIIFILFFIGAIISLPGIAQILTYYLIKVAENSNILFKLALNNIRTSKVLLNNIRLVVIGMVSVMIILSLSSSFTNALLGMARDYSYDISIIQGTDPIKINSIIYKDVNVDKVIETYFVGEGEIKGYSNKIPIGGIDPKTYKEFNDYFEIQNKDEFYKNLDQKDKNAAISDKVAEDLNKYKGDTIVLKVNNKEIEYKIVDTFNTKLAPDQVLINKENMIKDFGVTIPDSYNLQTRINANDMKEKLERELNGTSAKITTFDEDINAAKDNIQLLMNILIFFSLMTVVIGALGIINNIEVGFIQRKRDLIILNSVGMTNNGNSIIMFIESIIISIFSVGLGGIISYFAVEISNNIAQYIDLSVPIKYDLKAFLMISIGVFIILILCSCSAMLKCSRLSVVNELKCE